MQNKSKGSCISRLLRAHPDSQFVCDVVAMLTHGANSGFCVPHYSHSTPSAATAREHAEMLRKSIIKEVTLKHALGPSTSHPFQNFVTSSLGVRLKKFGGHRIIVYLSRPFGDSVKDFIDCDPYSFQFCEFDDAVIFFFQIDALVAEMAKQCQACLPTNSCPPSRVASATLRSGGLLPFYYGSSFSLMFFAFPFLYGVRGH